MITETTWAIVPLALLSLFLSWRWMLVLVGLTSCMSAAAVFIFGAIGVPPGYFMLAVALARVIAEAMSQRMSFPRELLGPVLLLLLFLITCVLVLWVAVVAFTGRVLVLSGAGSYVLQAATPYVFKRENIAQYLYLVLCAGFTVAIAYRLSRMPVPELRKTVHFAIVGTILAVDALCLYEALANAIGLPWPFYFFHSSPNSSWRPGEEQLYGVVRTAGPFSEPSALAQFYGGAIAYCLCWVLTRGSYVAFGLTVSCIVVMLVSLSTTAMVLIGIAGLFVIFAILKTVVSPRMPAWVRGRRVVAMLAVTVIVTVGALLFFEFNSDLINKIYIKILAEKSHSGSYVARTGSDRMALEILQQTGGVGIGIGSHRPNSLVLTLLSNTGLLGTLLFGLWMLQLLQPIYEPGRRIAPLGFTLTGVRWMTIGTLIGLAISGPILSLPILWLGFGLNLALMAALQIAQRHAAVGHGASLSFALGLARSP